MLNPKPFVEIVRHFEWRSNPTPLEITRRLAKIFASPCFVSPSTTMTGYYDEIEIEDFAWDPHAKVFHYPCPCGDRFEITKAQLRDGEEIAICPSCSLTLRVIYDYVSVHHIHARSTSIPN